MTTYAICITRSFYGSYYGPTITKTRLLAYSGQEWRGSRKDATDTIKRLESADYRLAHNEYCRPTYTLVRVQA
jgi:hypothetical protein